MDSNNGHTDVSLKPDETNPSSPIYPNHSLPAFLFGIPIAILGGLIGLGGAEFRLPVLAGPLKYWVKQAVPLNLAVSFVTLAASLAIRSRTLTFDSLRPFVYIILSFVSGAMITAFIGAGMANRLSKQQFERIILVLLVAIGVALVIEGFLPQEAAGFLPDGRVWRVVAGVGFGLAIGLVSSLLGVAGGELIIPSLIFAFGIDVKAAGTASLFISLPTVLIGVIRYAHKGAFAQRQNIKQTVAPMGLGSIIGAIIGGALVGIVPSSLLKIGLGIILIVSAVRIFRHSKSR